MKPVLLILLQLVIVYAQAQVKISGTVTTKPGNPVSGVNLFIQGTYDGATSDSLGRFSFTTDSQGAQTLIASFIGLKTQAVSLQIGNDDISLNILMNEEVNELNEVTINAGSFEASDTKKSVILKPLDIALTAGTNGDIYGAFGTLPGSHHVGEEGRLFVRGGESYETKSFMDGMLIGTPYFSKMPDLPTRGRFSPILFNGAVFSTGGYSAEYGQALSSIVALNTTALEPESKASVSLLSVGLQGSHATRWKKTSLALTGEYLHTGLSNKLFRQNIQWLQTPVITGSTLMFRHKTSDTGMLKSFGSFSNNSSKLLHNNFQVAALQEIGMGNTNFYFNTTWNEMLNDNWMMHAGAALNTDTQNLHINEGQLFTTKNTSQLKTTFTHSSAKKITTKMGIDWIYYDYKQEINLGDSHLLSFFNNQLSAFAESELKVSRYLAVKAGLRAEQSSLLQQAKIVPRVSAAVRTGKNSQLSAAYGNFFQNPADDYLKFSSRLGPEQSTHSILTWQYMEGTYTFRIEAYHKNYTDLVKFKNEFSMEPGNYTNEGSGYSRGIDLFWRNQKKFGKSDYWISYSWNDSERNYRDFPVQATPHYVSAHNFSAVYKKFFMPLNCFLSGSYSFASGRPYYNPNNADFMSDRTKNYHDASLGITHITYLFNTQTVLHLVVNNVFGFNNIYGYSYSNLPDESGTYIARPITPVSKRMAVLLISFQL
jgi:hypothetical protein